MVEAVKELEAIMVAAVVISDKGTCRVGLTAGMGVSAPIYLGRFHRADHIIIMCWSKPHEANSIIHVD